MIGTYSLLGETNKCGSHFDVLCGAKDRKWREVLNLMIAHLQVHKSLMLKAGHRLHVCDWWYPSCGLGLGVFKPPPPPRQLTPVWFHYQRVVVKLVCVRTVVGKQLAQLARLVCVT